jgi:hypothetical protein
MKYLTLWLLAGTALAQGDRLYAQSGISKSHLAIGVGIPTHPDMDIDENGLFFSLNYRRNSGKVFNWGAFFLRSSANSELDYFEDKARMLAYLNSPEAPGGIGTSWSKIVTYGLGAQFHVNAINRPRNFLSFSAGIGYYTSLSSNQRLVEVTEESLFTGAGEFISASITDFIGETRSERKTEPFLMPAITYQYHFKSAVFIGVEVNLFLDLDSQALTQHPVLANFYSFNLYFGKRF